MKIECGTNPCNACPVSLLPVVVRRPLGDLLQATVSELPVEEVRMLSRFQLEAQLQAGDTGPLADSLKGTHKSPAECLAVGVTALRKATRFEHITI